MPTLLHISDLHRTSTPRLGNDELLSAIFSDTKRWEKEGIPYPEVIVVSGDLIQGTSVDHPNPDSEIARQYAEAGTFLQQLTKEVVDSDPSRVIIVPGNHDVHWSRALQAMSPLETCPDGTNVRAFEANSTIRWNWKDQKAYEIIDRNMYESRLEHFRLFQAYFYASLNPSPLLQDDDIVRIEYPSLGLVVVGFASWHGNDCFCHIGEIASKALATARELLQDSRAPIAIAVWHHGVVGEPRAHDYMDTRIVHRLIDFGFSVGLHGHHHYAGAAPFELRLPNLTSMAVIGAGSLAVGDGELPMGERRQFNIVVIDPDNKKVTTHVRAMSSAGVFTGSHRDDFGGNTSLTLPLRHSPARPKWPTMTQRLDDAMTAATLGLHEEALNLLPPNNSDHQHLVRQIQIKALEGLERQEDLIKLLDPPQSQEEAVRIISVLLDCGRFDDAEARLPAMSHLIDQAVFRELAGIIATRRAIS